MKKLLVITLLALGTVKGMTQVLFNGHVIVIDHETLSVVPDNSSLIRPILNDPLDAKVPVCFGPRLPKAAPSTFIPEQQLHDIAIKIIGFGIHTKQLKSLEKLLNGLLILKLTDCLSEFQRKGRTLDFLHDISFWFDIIGTIPTLSWCKYTEECFPPDPQDHIVPEEKN